MHANLVDLVILVLIVLSGLAGLRQGFVKSFGGLFGTIAAFILALLFSDDLVLLLEKAFGARTAIASALAGHLPVAVLPMPLSIIVEDGLTALTAADLLAQLILILTCFLLITFAGARLLQVIFSAFDSLVSWGILGRLNSGLGMLLGVIKNLLILSIVLGLIQPAINLAAQLEYVAAQGLLDAIAGSCLAPKMLYIFMLLKGMLGIGSGE